MVWALSATQQGFEERSRTISLAVVALGVLICGLRFFKDALIPLVLAIALKHLLQPVINVLTNRPLRCCGRSLLAELMPGPSPRLGRLASTPGSPSSL